jgi:hypothetical protein
VVNAAGGIQVGGALTATTGTFSGNVSVAGVLSYEDVTNIDAVGVVTARNGIRIPSGSLGIGTETPAGTFQLGDSSGSNVIIAANTGIDINDGAINLYQATSNVNATPFIISTDVGGTETEKLRVTADGRVGVGTDNPDRKLVISQANSTAYSPSDFDQNYHVLKLNNTTDSKTVGMQFLIGSNGEAAISATETSDGNTDISFGARGGGARKERLRIRSNGDLILGPYDAPGSYTTPANNVPYSIKVAPYGWQHHSEIAAISMGNHSGSTGNDEGEIVFQTASNVHSSTDGLVEKLRIHSWNDIYANANFRINAPDVYYTATFTMDSTWTSYQTIAANLAADSVYLVSINWIHGTSANQPYYYTTSFLYHTCAGTNGTGAENEKTFMHSTHTGTGTGYLMTFRGKATSASGGGNTGSNIQAKVNSNWPGLTSGNKLRVAINRLMDGTRSFG